MDIDRVARLEQQVALLKSRLDGLTKQTTLGNPLGAFSPESPVFSVLTAYGLVLLSTGSAVGNPLINFSNFPTPVSLSGKSLQGGVPVQLQGVVYYIPVYK